MFDYRIDDSDLINLRTRFERVYIRTHPKPKRQTSAVIQGALILLVIASVIVSASHTIPAFLSTIEGDTAAIIKLVVALSAFAMVEVGMLVLAYVSTRRRAEAADKHINRQLTRGLLLAFTLAVMANLHSVLEPRFGGTQLWGVASFAVFVLVGVSAPTLAYIAGEVFGLTALSDEQKNAEAEAQWWSAFDAAWERALEQYRRGTMKAVRPSPLSVRGPLSGELSAGQPDGQADMDTTGHATGQGYTKRTDAREQVVQWLQEHPEDMVTPVRDLAVKIGVGKSTVSEVRSQMRNPKS